MTRLVVQGTGLYTPPAPVEGEFIIAIGQSNTWGPNPGLAGNTTGVLYWDSDVTIGGSGIVSTYWHAAHGTSFHPSHGPDRSTIEALLAAPGYSGKTAYLNVSLGSSPYPIWIDTLGVRYGLVKQAVQLAISQLGAAFPDVTSWKCRQVRNQGTSDMIVNNLPYQQQWAAAQTTFTGLLRNDMVGPAFGTFPHSWRPDLLIQQNPLLTGAFFVAQGVIPQQYIYAGETPGSSPHVLPITWPGAPTPPWYEPDEVHYTTQGNIDGGTLIGERIVFLTANGM